MAIYVLFCVQLLRAIFVTSQTAEVSYCYHSTTTYLSYPAMTYGHQYGYIPAHTNAFAIT